MARYDEVASRWIGVCLGNAKRNLSHERMIADGDRIYSYGRHFELARLLRDKKGQPRAFLLNGNTYSVTTTRHQSVIRSAVAGSGLPSVIVPHDALTSAGIQFDTLEIVESMPDRVEVKHFRKEQQPPRSKWRLEPDYETRDLTPEEIEAKIEERHEYLVKDWERQHSWDGAYWDDWKKRHPDPPERPTMEEAVPHWQRKVSFIARKRNRLFTSARGWNEIEVTRDADGKPILFEWETRIHRLGEAVIRGRVTSFTSIRCKSCKGSGAKPGAPIPQAWPFNQRAPEWHCEECGGRGNHGTREHARWAYFLSGWDHQEPRPLYFLCELPRKAKPTTVAEAYEALKPDTVLLGEQMERDIVRQGDIFAVQAPSIDKRTLRKQGARFEKRGFLLGTNHTATEVAYLPTGQTLVRGLLYHDPSGRAQDHVRRHLPDGWSIAVKNTVPTTK